MASQIYPKFIHENKILSNIFSFLKFVGILRATPARDSSMFRFSFIRKTDY